jgi:hypothetical protein
LRVWQTRSVFRVDKRPSIAAAAQNPKMREVQRSPDDEILLTELAFDLKNTITYEVSSVILVAEREQSNPHGKFRCFMDVAAKEFFVEIPNEGTMSAFSRSALLNIMELAEEAGAETIFMCVRKTVNKQEAYLKNFLFLGFQKLSEKEQKKISMTKTHSILKCALNSNDDDDE